MKKRIFTCLFILIAIIICLLVFFVFNKNKNSSKNSSDSGKTVTISYGLWGDDVRQAYTKKQIKAFEEKYPNIKVELNYASWDILSGEIDDIMADGRESDLMQINYNWLAEYSSDGNGFYDLNKLSDYIQLDAYSDKSIAYGQVNGKQNALPIAFNTSVPVYNKSMYDYYGIELPESIEELYAAAKIMKQDNVYQFGMEDKQIVIFLCGRYQNEYKASIVDENGNLNLTDSAASYLATTYKDCVDNYIICPRSIYTDTRIEGNRVAGVICWLNSIEKYKKIMTDAGNTPEVGHFLWTNTDETLGNFVKPSTMLAISAHTKHPKETAQLLEFITHDEEAVNLQGVEKGVPDSRIAQQILMKSGELNNDSFYATLHMNYYLEYMKTLPDQLEDGNNVDIIMDALEAYANGTMSLQETVTTLKGIR